MNFNIANWRAFTPGINNHEDWQAWLHDSAYRQENLQPDLSFLPAMQRRRLSPLARMVFQVAWPLAQEQEQQPVVFCSRHGETSRNLGLLTELGRGEELSPTNFSLSVHNAIIGLWSIMRKDTSEMTAISATDAGLELAVTEAVMLLASGASSVLVIVAEDCQPELYQPWIDDVPFAYALALQIVAGEDWCLEVSSNVSCVAKDKKMPPALALLPLLLGQTDCLSSVSATGTNWLWRRHL